MVRTNTSKFHELTPEQQAELDKCKRMVEHFDRKGLYNTFWHDDLARLEKAYQELENKE